MWSLGKREPLPPLIDPHPMDQQTLNLKGDNPLVWSLGNPRPHVIDPHPVTVHLNLAFMEESPGDGSETEVKAHFSEIP
ncbi:MAG: hypothetical protein GY915_06345 [bacterium]|nr:hypothetical protein [bacterium]